jgi:hypothetical protein
MIRRGFWLLTGAVLGVTGYRKATRLARTLTGQSLLGGPAATQHRPALRGPANTRAVRAGAAEQRLALPLQPDTRLPEATPADRIAAAAARATAAAGFVRDVRDGMAEYWDLHRSESDRTLGSQRDRTWSGDSQPGRREH